MGAVQALTGQGGWPMSVWLTPDGRPFYAGTYFPPEDMPGRPGFRNLLLTIHEAWDTKREQITEQSGKITGYLTERARENTGEARELDAAILDTARDQLAGRFDPGQGGFGRAPKFPTPHQLTFLLRHHARTGDPESLAMVRTTLDAMAAGGIHDHLAGGFHRYSTDARWLAPHFEKMLYDQAGLALAYLDAFAVTGDPVYERVVRGILDYVLGYLTHPQGGFLSAEDADSEGEEGTFYVWQPAEIDAVLGADAERFRAVYDVTAPGNWEGKNILHTADPSPILDEDLAGLRLRLLAARDERIRPHLDDKVITAWNGYMIEAFARAGAALAEPRYLEAARRAADFVDRHLVRSDGRLLRHYRDGAADVPAFQEDYAFLARGRLALYEATFAPGDLARARELSRDMLRLFALPGGGFAFQGSDQDSLVAPVVEVYDGAMPSGNSAAAMVLLRLGHLLADRELETAGWSTLGAFAATLEQGPSAYLEMLSALDFGLGPRMEIVIAGTGSAADALVTRARAGYRPNAVLLRHTGPDDAREMVPYLAAQTVIDDLPTAYVCRNYACDLPVRDPAALGDLLAPR
jgi:uncharacterized protein YyaL (SSP411 family)